MNYFIPQVLNPPLTCSFSGHLTSLCYLQTQNWTGLRREIPQGKTFSAVSSTALVRYRYRCHCKFDVEARDVIFKMLNVYPHCVLLY